MSSPNILEIIKSLGKEESLDEAVKEANEKEAEVTEETKEAEEATEETKEAEATEETDGSTISDADAQKIANLVLSQLNGTQETNTGTQDKVDVLVDELNKEAEELSGSQEKIVTALFNEFCLEEGSADSEDIVKMASENEVVPYLVDSLVKYASYADSLLAEKYEDDYNEDDVIKLASVVISSVEDPFGFEQMQEDGNTKEAELDNEAQAILDKLAQDGEKDVINNLLLDKIKEEISKE